MIVELPDHVPVIDILRLAAAHDCDLRVLKKRRLIVRARPLKKGRSICTLIIPREASNDD